MTGHDFPLDKVRSPREIARRALTLHAVCWLAHGGARDDVLRWLEDHNLREALSPDELKFIENQHPSSKQMIDFSWHTERLIVLLWALNLVESLPHPDRQCDTRIFENCLPPFVEQSMEQFISGAIGRSEDELRKEAERTLDLHWEARDARLNSRTPRNAIDIEVVQERHHAINWVTGYCGLEWDEVTTDT